MKMKMSGLWLRYASSSVAVDQRVYLSLSVDKLQPEITTFSKGMPICNLHRRKKQFLAIQDDINNRCAQGSHHISEAVA